VFFGLKNAKNSKMGLSYKERVLQRRRRRGYIAIFLLSNFLSLFSPLDHKKVPGQQKKGMGSFPLCATLILNSIALLLPLPASELIDTHTSLKW